MKPVSTISVKESTGAISTHWERAFSHSRVKYSQGHTERMEQPDDGYHIALLILANLYRLCPQFLRENRVYWLRSPLFIEQDKNGNPLSCYYTDEEFDKVRGKLKGYIKRVKGLGQLNEKDLKASMFSTTGNQRMDQIIYSEEGIEQLCQLMGVDIKPRKKFVFSRIDFSKYGTS